MNGFPYACAAGPLSNHAGSPRSPDFPVHVETIDRTKLDSLRSMLEQYPGPCPVALEVSSPGDWRVNLAETGLFVDPTDALLTGLERLFGSKVCELH